MPPRSRRDLPDNLDPLVDTLSNVVGILVIVVALTQIQVGDALDRLIVIEEGAKRVVDTAIEQGPAHAASNVPTPSRFENERARILARSNDEFDATLVRAERALQALAALPAERAAEDLGDQQDAQRRLASLSARLDAASGAMTARAQHARALTVVPKELVARLPNPTVIKGAPAWILCRYQRCYLTDQRQLLKKGSDAILQAIGPNRVLAELRNDEYESIAHQLRKRDIGLGDLRWGFVTKPERRVQLEWRNRDGGIPRTALATSPALRAWLASRSPERDVIQFQVWSDSFETYLEARRLTEAAGFRAGWRGFAKDEELQLVLTTGPPAPEERPIGVD